MERENGVLVGRSDGVARQQIVDRDLYRRRFTYISVTFDSSIWNCLCPALFASSFRQNLSSFADWILCREKMIMLLKPEREEFLCSPGISRGEKSMSFLR